MFIGGDALDDPDPEQAVETRVRIAPHVRSATVFFISESPWEKVLTSVLRGCEKTLNARNILQILKNAQLLTGAVSRAGLMIAA